MTVLCISCEKKEPETKCAILLKNGATEQFAESENILLYEFEVYSLNSTVKQFKIVSADNENGTKTLFDTIPGIAKYTCNFEYTVPSFTKDSTLVSLTMQATDNDGNTFQLKCYITVVGGAQLLPELAGITMFSGSSNNFNAFSLNDPSHVFLRALADSAQIDIYDYMPELADDILSREWRTNTDVLFAKANNFNYAKATLISVKNTFNDSNKDKFVNNISPNDIILFGKNNSIFGVIQITDVVDNVGVNNDYYRFNIKIKKVE